MAENRLADDLAGKALMQLAQSYVFKLPRINQIRKFRALYNNQVARQLRIRYNVPIPIFGGMIDTLQADLDDGIILKAEETDPKDWKALKKFNAALEREQNSVRPGAKWNSKFRMSRQECIMTGRGILKYVASSEGGYHSDLEDVAFEDFMFEPKGGGQLEKHLFCGQINIWKSEEDIKKGAKDGIYDPRQVKKLTDNGAGNEYKVSSMWDNYDYSNRFAPLGLAAEANNYVGEKMFNLAEWVMTYKGKRWYMVFDTFSDTWLRFEKLEEVNSSGYLPWMSFASHEDKKNFASKGFADDLYPIAIAMSDMFNEDLENKKRRNSNARAYDKDMFENVAELDQAQMGRDRLVRADTKGGSRRISEGIYAFETPEITGTIDTLKYMEDLAGRNLGVNDLQKGDAGAASKKVGVTYAELGQVSKRLAFESQPIIEVGQELGMRVFAGLKDYLREPLSIKILGEEGYQWDFLKRIDLNIERDFEFSVTSQSKENKMNVIAKETKMNALEAVANRKPVNPNANYRMIDEHELREAGWSEAEIALILDPNSHADKTTIAETSAAIQDMMLGTVPPLNYNATAYFLQKILDFVKTHQGDTKIKKNLQKFLAYIDTHMVIASENEQRRAQKDALVQKTAMMNANIGQGLPPTGDPMVGGVPVTPAPPPAPVGAPAGA